jgi:rhodanese-related sulfurtransferase
LIPQLAPADLVRWREDASREPPFVVDVREPWEFDHCRIDGSVLIPLGELPRRVDELPAGRAIVMVCHTGRRSQHAAMFLEQAGFADVHNLAGGVERWAVEIDPAMKRY